jgi:DNA-binding IscR family transcriptional regulator
LLKGTPGPKGGYEMNRPPEEVRLLDIVRLFDSESEELPCPFGPDWCGHGTPCPLHDSFTAIREMTNQFLATTTLAGFANADPPPVKRR